MKKVINLIFLILSVIFSIEIVSAAVTDDFSSPAETKDTAGYIVTSDFFTSRGIRARMSGIQTDWIWNNGDTSPYSPTLLFIKKNSTDVDSVPAFCLNPAKSAKIDYSGQQIDNDGRMLKTFVNKTSTSDLKETAKSEKNVYEIGLIYILENGYTKKYDGVESNYFTSADDRIKSLATTNALRLFQLLFLNYNDNIPAGAGYLGGEKYIAAYYNFLEDNVFGKTYDGTDFDKILRDIENVLEPGPLNNNIRQQVSETIWENVTHSAISTTMGTIDAYQSGSYVDKTTMAKNETLKLLVGALKESYKVLTTDSAAPSVLGVKQQGAISNESGETQTRKIEYKLATYNFDSGEVYANLNVTTPVDGLNYKMLFKTSNGTLYEVDETYNLIALDPERKGTLILEFSAAKDALICQEIKYDLTFEYSTPLISIDAHYGHVIDQDKGDVQELIFNFITTGPRTATINDKFTLCEWQDDCRYLKDSCETKYSGDASSMACRKFDENFNSKCAVCSLDAVLPSCTEVDTKLYLDEGTAYDADATDNLKCDTARESVLDCVIRGKDPAENSYEATKLLSGNPYCKVFCKEDYHISLPGLQKSTTGRYFTLAASISGAKTCYTGKIDKTKFENDINSYKAEYTSSADDVAKTIALQKQEKAVEDYNKCFTWNADFDYKYEPKIKFQYEEEYFELIKNDSKNEFVAFEIIAKEPTAVDSIEPTEPKTYYYSTNNIQDDYCKNSTDGDCASKSTLSDVGTTTVELSKDINKQIYNGTYVKVVSTVEANYQTPSNFYSLNSYRTIAVPQDESTLESNEQVDKLENQLPIAQNAATGVYNYSIKIEDLGEFYSNSADGNHTAGELGRIWGAENSVVSIITNKVSTDASNQHVQCLKNPLGELNTSNVDLVENDTATTTLNNGVYVCEYQVNEDICRIDKDSSGNPVYYLNNEIVTKETYYSHCPGDDICEKKCTYDRESGNYYGSAGTIVNESTFKAQCNDGKPKMCVEDPAGSGNYFGRYGELVSKEKYLRECNSCKKEPSGADFKYTGLDGVEVTKSVYDEQCTKMCQIVGDTHYYYGDVVSEETYNSCCDPCPDCPTTGGGTDIPDCEGPNCDPSGGGLFLDGKLNVNVRPITNENINPNNRPLGNNWAVDNPEVTLHPDPDPDDLSGITLDSAMELKAVVTTYEIQESGELIYDPTRNENQTLTVTLDRALLSDIKAENSNAKATGGYANNTLACYDYTIGTKTYENVFCYSTFLDKLINDHREKFEFTIPDGGSRLEGESDRKTDSFDSKYWKPWTTVNTSRWEQMTNYNIITNSSEYTTEGYGTTLNIGPSWK